MATATKPRPAKRVTFNAAPSRNATPPKPAPSKPAPFTGATPNPGVRNTVEAPARINPHAKAPEATKAGVALTKDHLKASGVDKADAAAIKAGKLANLIANGKDAARKMDAPKLDAYSASDLSAACKAWGLTGYSSLKKGELVEFIQRGGEKPKAAKDSARDVAERLKAAKADGKVSGPISALTKGQGEAVLAKLAAGETVKVTKPAPKAGTADDKRARLAQYDRAAVNAFLKARCGRTYSSAKVADIDAALAHFAKA